MMEASVVPQESGHMEAPTGALSSSPFSSSQPPSRPCRPRPPPPMMKPSQLQSRPPLPSTPILPPPLLPSSTPQSLPPPLSPIIVSQSSEPPVSSYLTPFSSLPSLSPLVSALPTPPPVLPTSSPAPLSLMDQLVGSVSVWWPKGLSPERITCFLEKHSAGTFLAHTSEDKDTVIWVRLPDERGSPVVHSVAVQQHQTFFHLEGSSLVFDDIFKMISFYCTSRDILLMPLKLPLSITTTTRENELEVLSAMGSDFWVSELNQETRSQDQATQFNTYLFINPLPVEQQLSAEGKPSSVPKLNSSLSTEMTSLQNGKIQKKTTPQVKVPKRPPPRPPSLSSGFGMGLLFSSPPSPQTITSVFSECERKEEVRGAVSERFEIKSKSTSSPPPRPSVPQQPSGAAPPPPLQQISGRQLQTKDNEQNPTKKTERQAEKKEDKSGSTAGLLGDKAEKDELELKEEKGKEKNDEQKTGMGTEDTLKTNSPCSLSTNKPSRPVPPPRTKPPFTNSPAHSSQPAGGSTNPSAGKRKSPSSPTHRPDVSLYSPKGGVALGADLDSCSTSSTEEEGDLKQNQEPTQGSPADSRYSKAAVRRTPTVMLDRARHRLSTVLTGLICHDGRLTKRIIELARDPLSYFGNLVKDHRAFTLESMSKHLTSTDLLQEIRQMMTQLKSYLLQSAELQALVEPQHQYTQDKLENIVEAALCKSVLKPLKEPIYKSLEKLHIDARTMEQLAQNQSAVLRSTTTALGITTSIPEAPAMEKISIKLSRLHQEYSPQKKIEMLLKTCKLIYDSMSVSCPGRSHGADDFLPVLMYVLARSNLPALQLDIEYMMELMDPSLTLGEGSYYLTTTYGAMEHIKTFDQQRSAMRQLSREVQDSIHRWERRRTLNQEKTAQGSVRDFLTVFCPEVGINPKTLGVLPTMTIQELTEQCAARFEQESFTLSVFMDGVQQHVGPGDLALNVKNSGLPGAYCFIFHPIHKPDPPPARTSSINLLPARTSLTDPPSAKTSPTDPFTAITGPTHPPPARTGPMVPPTARTSLTDPPPARTSLTDPPSAKTSPTDPFTAITGPTQPPPARTGPMVPPTARTSLTDLPPARTSLTDPPPARTSPTDPPSAKSSPTDPFTAITGPTHPPPARPAPTDPFSTRSVPTVPPPARTGPMVPPPARTSPTDPPSAKTSHTDPFTAITGPTHPPPARPAPTDPFPTRSGPTVPPPARTGPMVPPTARTSLTDPPPARTRPTDPPPARPGPTDPPPARTSPTDPPPARTNPTDPPPARTSPTDPPPARTSPTDPPPARTSPTDPPPARTSPTDPPPARTSPTDPPPARTDPTDPLLSLSLAETLLVEETLINL